MAKTNDNAKPLKDRLAVITGASRGIGRAAALAYAKAGAHVIALARTVGGLEELDDEVQAAGGSATLVPVDLTDFDALDRLGASIHERWKKLDILLANGAILGPLTPLPHLTPKDWSKLIDTNVTANYRLIRSLDPLLRQSDAGRAIFLSSSSARSNRPYWGGYSATKAALESLAYTYAGECEKTNVRVTIVDPGTVRTAMRAKAAPGEDPMTLPPPEDLGPMFVELASPSWTTNRELIKFREWREQKGAA